MSETRRRSSDRFKKRNQLEGAKKRPRQFLLTPLGNILAGEFMEHLAKFLAGEMVDQPKLIPGSNPKVAANSTGSATKVVSIFS